MARPALHRRGEICSSAEATRGHCACVHALLGSLKLAEPGVTTEPRGHTEATCRPADIFTTDAVQDAAWPWMFAHHPPMQEHEEICSTGFLTRRHPTVEGESKTCECSRQPMDDHTQLSDKRCNTQQTAACRNGQKMSGTALRHRWTHEAQIALLRRRAAMTRTVLPFTSPRDQLLRCWLVDRTSTHWTGGPLFDGGEDVDTKTDATVLDDEDDDDDIASSSDQV